MDSSGIAAVIAHISFWLLLVYGWFWEELRLTGVAVFLVLWLCGYFGLRSVPHGSGMVSSYVAVLDVALVLLIFKGDVKLS